jgi:putative ABC transport system permease protein
MRSPGFAAAAIIALGLGIGANTAIFSLLNAVLLRPLPYKDPSRLVTVWQQPPSSGMNDVSAADFLDWRARSHAFERIAAWSGTSFNVTGGDRPEKLIGMHVSSGFLETLGATPAVGHGLPAEEERPGAERSVVIGDSLWKRRFGGDRSAIGRTIHLDRRPYTVVGIMPPGFQFEDRDYELWVPLTLDPARASRNFYDLETVARLKPGIAIQQARSEMDSIARQLAAEYPKTNREWGVRVVALTEQISGNIRPAILVLMGAVAFVLLIACVNVANLMLYRAAGRRKEFAIRNALGARRMDVVKRLLSESLLLASAGGALGLLLAQWSMSALVAIHPAGIPRLDEVGLDWRVLLFTISVSLLTGILFGLAPAVQVSKLDLYESLKEGGRGASEGKRGRRTRNLLVIAEVASSMVLLAGAGLMIRSFAALSSVKTGFHPENLLTMNVSISEEEYASEQQVAGDFARVLERIQAIPGVTSAAAVTNLPSGGWNQGRAITIEGRPTTGVQAAGYLSISPNYFRTISVPLVRGREFTTQDRHGSPDVVIISESMARRYWPGGNPIGRRVVSASHQFRGRGLGPAIPREIVGVVGDIQHVGHEDETSIEMYAPQLQNVIPFTYLIVRTAGDPANAAPAIVRGVNEVLKESAVSAVKTMGDRLGESYAKPRFQMLVLGLFASLALLLATIGIYSVAAYSAAQRTHEIGIRMALGADASRILSLVLGQGMKLVAAGVVLGLCGAIAATRFMAGMLYGVQTTDALTFAGVTIVLVATAVAANIIPAWRASRLDPVRTLRSQG